MSNRVEYARVTLTPYSEESEQRLLEVMGNLGWILVCVSTLSNDSELGAAYYFYRPITGY